MKTPLTWLITRGYARPVTQLPDVTFEITWRQVGRVKAFTKSEALEKAVLATGAPSDELVVVGISANPTDE